MAAISEGEVAVYDRQLRLWGVQAQQRLLKSKVLIWGLEGVNVEACKNLVLAGVSLTVRDHRVVSADDAAYNYFLRPEDIGKSRAECAAKRIQEMNPLCTVSSSGAAPGDAAKFREEIRGFDVVCLAMGVIDRCATQAASINAACRQENAAFLLSVGVGELAFFFSDFQEHMVQERSSAQGGAGGAPPAAAADAPKAEPERVSFSSFEDFLGAPVAELATAKVDASHLLVALFFAFTRSLGKDAKAKPEDAAKFEEFCRGTAKCEPKVDGMNSLQEAFGFFFLEPLMHVASVLGGLFAQEVIKFITKRDPPLVNAVCFNAHTCAAIVERIPAEKRAPKRKAVEVESLDLDD
eukprot:TRINITY_DN31194_c0_g1_i1.p2 TRINITY_DN31194_c0_g1~~TRINITY_DN31194_c0_g1_i1.p2  ORF type:complete len:351 (+),score=112.03 TRINITY_DN31194_c0_g1_i1:148-1200(+)